MSGILVHRYQVRSYFTHLPAYDISCGASFRDTDVAQRANAA